MSNKLGQEPAFPFEYISERNGGEAAVTKWKNHKGISKRFYAACAILQGFASNGSITEMLAYAKLNLDKEREFVVRAAYQLADELLKQENL